MWPGLRAGSLVNLAKYPASTVQILGAEKALFRCGGTSLPFVLAFVFLLPNNPTCTASIA
jgi:hypothetical protein